MARILVAEDQSSVAAFVARALAADGHVTDVVGTGLDALDRLHEDEYDLLLTDIVMPGMDGIALALKAGATWPDMRILLMTGFAHERQRAHNIDALVHSVLQKPFSLAELRSAVAEVLSAGEIDPSITKRISRAV